MGPKVLLSENGKLNFNKHFKFNNQIEESYDLKYFMVFDFKNSHSEKSSSDIFSENFGSLSKNLFSFSKKIQRRVWSKHFAFRAKL